MIGYLPINPGMQVPHRQGWTVSTLSAQQEVDRVALWDLSLVERARDHSLNRAEFSDLNGRQNEIARLSGQFTKDGLLDETERARLNELRTSFQHDFEQYRTGDYQPQANDSFLYDAVTNGRLSREQALTLRMNASTQAFATGSNAPDDTPPAA